ncbi:protein of unknown function [Agreia sp. COWG]|nr:protein of unknown function [Agreia sp. COWG]
MRQLKLSFTQMSAQSDSWMRMARLSRPGDVLRGGDAHVAGAIRDQLTSESSGRPY